MRLNVQLAKPEQPVIFLIDQQSHLANYFLSLSNQLLDNQAQQKLTRLAEKPAREFKISRLLIKALFDQWLGDWQLQHTANGKPYLKSDSIRFNLSHSHGLIGLLISPDNTDCGLDLEYANPKLDPLEVASTVFTGFETVQMEQANNSLAHFYNLWVCKEARLKLIGSGFSQNPKSLELNLSNNSIHDCKNDDHSDIWLYQTLAFQQRSFHMAASLCSATRSAPKVSILDLLDDQLTCKPLALSAQQISHSRIDEVELTR